MLLPVVSFVPRRGKDEVTYALQTPEHPGKTQRVGFMAAWLPSGRGYIQKPPAKKGGGGRAALQVKAGDARNAGVKTKHASENGRVRGDGTEPKAVNIGAWSHR
jgi:hypothetical protein